jgi:hypothetical protein
MGESHALPPGLLQRLETAILPAKESLDDDGTMWLSYLTFKHDLAPHHDRPTQLRQPNAVQLRSGDQRVKNSGAKKVGDLGEEIDLHT